MSLGPGVRLGPYEVIAAIGAGGMGEVYRARDSKLNRDVALKVLPASVASDPDRLARFHREAQVLASLNHPHIGAIYGFEGGPAEAGPYALVLEFVDGPTLADRIAQGPIPIDEALPIAIQIAEALEAAHEQGIIHRDLKPANIKLRPDGTVKVLDFGLAKLSDPGFGARDSGLEGSLSPTITSPALMTGVGVLLGTAAYMAPEQARGKTVDKRADIWAFGCVLFEMLTGTRPFGGDETTDVIVSIVSKEPEWGRLPRSTSPSLRHVLQRCLRKDARDRLRDIGDARHELTARDTPAQTVVVSGRSIWRLWSITAIVVLLLGLAIGLAFALRTNVGSEIGALTRASIAVPADITFYGSLSLSPDGRAVAFAAQSRQGTLLWVRRLDRTDAYPLVGTDDAYLPFWSPDGQSIAFFAGAKLKKVNASGGAVQTICDADSGRGGTWTEDGFITFAPHILDGLYRVSADGGTPTRITVVSTAQQDNSHRFPHFLPDRRHVLFRVRSGNPRRSGIYLGDLDGAEPRMLLEADSDAIYLPPGYVLFARGSTLLMQAFDAATLQLSGTAIVVAEHVGYDAITDLGTFSAASNGTVVYYEAGRGLEPGRSQQLVWFTRTGARGNTVGDPGVVFDPVLSPDHTRVAFDEVDIATGTRDIWINDLRRNVSSRLTFGGSYQQGPVWSPDGHSVAYVSTRDGGSLFSTALDATQKETKIGVGGGISFLTDWSRDGKSLIGQRVDRDPQGDLWIMSTATHDLRPLADSRFTEQQAHFSPHGQWIAYVSDESGRSEVYVQRYPDRSVKIRVSDNGGLAPAWRDDGLELFYVARDRNLMAVTVNDRAADTPVVSGPRALFQVPVRRIFLDATVYAASADGQRFLVNASLQEPSDAPPIALMENVASLGQAGRNR